MSHVRCRVCGRNRKRRLKSTYIICYRCWKPACNKCSVTRLQRQVIHPEETREVSECRYCVAEQELST